MKIDIKPEYIGPPLAFLYKRWIDSLKYEVHGHGWLTEQLDRGAPVMFAIWHNELFSLTGFGMLEKMNLVTMASDSRDGQYITEILDRIGYKVARGSSTRGGVKAMMTMSRLMKKEKKIGVITVDGPKGPRHKFKHGIISLARKTGSVIIPARAIPESAFVFEKSWDQFELPKPFSKVKIKMGKPFRGATEKLDEDGLKAEAKELERRMTALGE